MLKWTLPIAQQLIRGIDLGIRDYGYTVALYGSVLKSGIGNDLDLLFIPWRLGYSQSSCVLYLESIGWKKCKVESSIIDRNMVGFMLNDRAIEAVFYNTRMSPPAMFGRGNG